MLNRYGGMCMFCLFGDVNFLNVIGGCGPKLQMAQLSLNDNRLSSSDSQLYVQNDAQENNRPLILEESMDCICI